MAKVSGAHSPADMVGRNVLELFGETLAKSVSQHDEKVYELKKEYSHEEPGITLDHQPAAYLSKKIPLFNSEGEITGTLGISVDITERKRMEEELKIAKEKAEISSQVKSQFVAAVNHELRTPLASIIGLVDLLKDEKIDRQEAKKITASIENSAQHLLNLVDDILDFSKLETGKQTLQITPINLSVLSSEVQELLKPLANNKNLELNLVIDSSLPRYLLSDARILRHILINLASNAIKFTEKGQVTIQIQVLEKIAEKIRLKMSISDTGMGIPADKIELVFKPFQQLNTTNIRSNSRSGTGLGLTIVKKLSEAIDARLEVKSELGKGSIFSMVAEFIIADEKIIENDKALPSHLLSDHHRKLRVLIVEDDTTIQYIHKKFLTNLDCDVDVVSNATDAIKTLKSTHDIIFLDMSLPDLTGYDLMKKIRSTSAFNGSIVIISAFLDKEDEIACLQAGANSFVSKPVSQAKFKELLEQHCLVH